MSDNLQVFLWEGSFCLSFPPHFFFLHATFGSVLCAFRLFSSFYTLHLGVFFVHFISSLLFTRYIWEYSLCISSLLFTRYIWEYSLCISSLLFFLRATFGSVLCAFHLPLLSSFYTLHLRKPFSQDVIVSHSCPFSRYPCYTCYRDGKAGVPRSVVFKTDASKCLLSVDPRRRAEHPATL